MKKEIWAHRLAYAVLISGLLLGTYLFLATWPNRLSQRIVALSLGSFYATWGVVTHTKTRTITKGVLAEYLGVSLLGVVMLLIITL